MIFIGFSKHDEAAARALALALRSASVEVYCSAVSGTIKGGSFWQQIEHAIDTCDTFIELCGTNPASKSSESEIVTANNRLARGSKFLIVPVLLPGVGPPGIHISLRAYECVQLSVDPEQFSAADKSALVERLRELGALSSSLSSKPGAARVASAGEESVSSTYDDRAESPQPARKSASKPGWLSLRFNSPWLKLSVTFVGLLSVGYLGWQQFGSRNPTRASDRSIGSAPPIDKPRDSRPTPVKPPEKESVKPDPPTTSDHESEKDPYNGWKLPKAQAGLVSLDFDPISKLEEFAVDGTGAIPMRDGTGTLVIKARSALEDEKCALVLVLIPGGSFLMGSTDGAGIENERPQHRVDVKPFFIAKTELTQAQWQRVMSSNSPGNKGPLFPVAEISWDDTAAFCRKLDLARPTEAQWEYACRAGTTTAFSFGDDAQKLGDYAWFKRNADSGSHVIAFKLPNPWGLYDVHGNVSEWCEDSYVPDYKLAPVDGSAVVTADKPIRVMRGGNVTFNDDFMRSAARGMYKGSKGADFVGFRPARAVRD